MEKTDKTRTSLNLTGKHHEIIQGLMAEWDRQQGFVINRLIEWIAEQDEDVQGWILRTVPKQYDGDLAQLILERAASRSAPQTEQDADDEATLPQGGAGGLARAGKPQQTQGQKKKKKAK